MALLVFCGVSAGSLYNNIFLYDMAEKDDDGGGGVVCVGRVGDDVRTGSRREVLQTTDAAVTAAARREKRISRDVRVRVRVLVGGGGGLLQAE